MIPGLTDAEAPAIGARRRQSRRDVFRLRRIALAVCGEVVIRGVARADTIPRRKNKILNRVREIRGGKLNDPNFKSRMRGEGIYAEQMAELFQLARKKSGITERWPKFTTEHFRRPGKIS